MNEKHTTESTSATADDCGPVALYGWSPPDLPADTRLKRWVDRVLPRTGLPALLYLALVIGLLNLAPHLPRRAELGADGLAALVGGSWCLLNYWRCRHAHCLVTAPGWLALAGFSWLEAGLGRSVIGGNEQLVLLAVLVLGLAFEGGWYLARGTNAVTCLQGGPQRVSWQDPAANDQPGEIERSPAGR